MSLRCLILFSFLFLVWCSFCAFSSLLFKSDFATVNGPAIELRKTVAVDRIVEKKGEIREQIQPVILTVPLHIELTARRRIVVVIHLAGRPQGIAPPHTD